MTGAGVAPHVSSKATPAIAASPDSLPDGSFEIDEIDWGFDSLDEHQGLGFEPAPESTDTDGAWTYPKPLSESEPAPQLDPVLLPPALRPWLQDNAERLSVPLEMVAIPALVALGATVGRSIALYPKRYDRWEVVPNLWGIVVGPSSSMKTPALREGLRPLKAIAARATELHEANRLTREAEATILEAQHQQLLRQARSDKTKPTLASEIAEAQEKLESLRQPGRRFTTSDPTVEMLTELLRYTPRGLLIERDELIGLLDSLDKKGREGDREFYLEAFNSVENYTVDRIGRGTLHIPALTLSIIGGIQPGKMDGLVLGAVSGRRNADGLLQRFQLAVYPEPLTEYHHVDRPIDLAADRKAHDIYTRLADFDPTKHPELDTTRGTMPGIGFEALAQDLFDEWLIGNMRRLRSGVLDSTPAFHAHIGKYRGLVAKLALLFHLTDTIESGNIQPVSAQALQLAIEWVAYLEGHARKIYAPELQRVPENVRELALRLLDGHIQDGTPIRDVYRHGWRALKSAGSVNSALDHLVEKDWVRIERVASPDGGRPSDRIRINPNLDAFIEELIP